MKHRYRWIVFTVIMISCLQLAACTSEAPAPAKVEPGWVEPIGEGGRERVMLTEKAAERLDLQTASIREEQVVRMKTVIGEIVVLPGASASASVPDSGALENGDFWVRMPLTEGEVSQIDDEQPALFRPLNGNDEAAGWMAREEVRPEIDDEEDEDNGAEDESGVLYYKLDVDEHDLVAGERVVAELPLLGSGMQMVIPYDALIYDVEGGNWVYIKEPGALAFTLHSVTVDYIEGDLVFLSDGPPVGSEVVTSGVMELYGLETGVSK